MHTRCKLTKTAHYRDKNNHKHSKTAFRNTRSAVFSASDNKLSILKDASYIGNPNKNVQLVLIKIANQAGAAYVEEISYNLANGGKSEYEMEYSQ